MDTYADDLAELIEQLDLHDVVLVGHSTGGGDSHALHRRATARRASPRPCSSDAIPPLMLKTDANPGGVPIEVVRRDPRRRAAAIGRSSTRT